MKPTDKRAALVKRFAPTVLWIETGLVAPRKITASTRFDPRVSQQARRARRALRAATRNATTNSPLVAPGLAPFSTSLGVIARTASRR